MTDETLIEIIARSICRSYGEEWEDDFPPSLQSWRWRNDDLGGTYRELADAILTALKDVGYVIERDWRPIEEAPRSSEPIMCINFKTKLLDLRRWGQFNDSEEAGWFDVDWQDGEPDLSSYTHFRPFNPPEGE